jgi:serine/threonine-protein kinase
LSLETGDRLGRYEILAPIGAGGMGEVYRAHDERLDRDVAIKVLPDEVAGDKERLARFEREAKLLASLNHQNIATLHGLEEHEGQRFLVMELAEGETLAERIKKGPIPVDDALPIALQIAEGLEAAHEQGIIHRDLKPANVMLSPEGKAKILDFGLAKAWQPEESGPDLTESPTLTAQMTADGVLLGTAAYMSPEQARGKPVDKRADIWAFGVVLWEMLTGERLFTGNTASDVLASVLKEVPNIDALPAETPSRVRDLLLRCLVSDPKHRLRDIGDARIELDFAGRESVERVPADLGKRRGAARWVWITVGAAAGLMASALLWSPVFKQPPGPAATVVEPVRRSLIQLPEGVSIAQSSPLAIYADGSRLAFAGERSGRKRLFIRQIDSLEVEEVSHTEGASKPFFSPDGEWVAFFDGVELKKVSLRGGDMVALCEVHHPHGGTWSDDGWIYFTHGEANLARVPEVGGPTEEVPVGEVRHVHALPGGRGILITIQPPGRPSYSQDASVIAHLSGDGELKDVLRGGCQATFVSTGHIVFLRAGGLYAVPFDLERLEATAPPVEVQPGVWHDSVWTNAPYGIARDGTLIYAAGGNYAKCVPTWIDREGNEEPLDLLAGVYNSFALSPDQTKLAIQVVGGQDQIQVFDIARGTLSRLTLQGGNFSPVWSHDGKEVFFASNRDGDRRMFRKPADGSGTAQRVLTDSQSQLTETKMRWPGSVSPDGRYLLFTAWVHAERGADIWLLELDGQSDPEPLVASPATESCPMFSPCGRWVVYFSDKTGFYEIFVRPFPDADRREWQISSGGGDDARWSPQGDEIFYRHRLKLISTPYTANRDFNPGSPRVLFEKDFHNSYGLSFEVSANAERFLVNKPDISISGIRTLTLVTGWASELKRLVPTE